MTAHRDPKNKVDVATLCESAALKVVKLPDTQRTDLEKLVGRFNRVDRALAKRDDLSVTLLEKLSHSSDRITRSNVTRHPNTDHATLLRLAPQFPSDFLKNPVFDWLLLQDPGFLKALDDKLLASLVKRTACPESFLIWAAKYGERDAQLAAAMNPNTPRESLAALANSDDQQVAEAASYHRVLVRNIDTDDLEARFRSAFRQLLGDQYSDAPVDGWWSWYRDKPWDNGYLDVAQFHAFPFWRRVKIASLDAPLGPHCRRIVGPTFGNPYTPFGQTWNQPRFPLEGVPMSPRFLEYLGSAEDPWGRWFAATRPECPPTLLKTLAVDEMASGPSHMSLGACAPKVSIDIRYAVAGNSKCPPSVLKKLAQDLEPSVRQRVAKNMTVPTEILEQLANDTDLNVRRAVAVNRRTQPAILMQLFREKELQFCIAGNPSCPAELIEEIAHGQDRTLQVSLASNPASAESTLRLLIDCQFSTTSESIPADIIYNPGCTESLLIEILKLFTKSLRAKGSQRWFGSRETDFCVGIAGNPHFPLSRLDELVQMGGRWGKISALEKMARESDRPELLDLLADKERYQNDALANPSCANETLSRFVQDKHRTLRRIALTHHNSPVEMSEQLDIPIKERMLVAEHAQSHIVLSLLGNDTDKNVRKRARANIFHPDFLPSILEQPNQSAWIACRVDAREYGKTELQAAIDNSDILYPAPMSMFASRAKSRPARILAFCDGIDPAGLAKGSVSSDWLQRMAIARNRITPSNILRKMHSDANHLVASQADLTLKWQSKWQRWQSNKNKAIDRRIARASKRTFSISYEKPAAWIAKAVRAEGGKEILGTTWEQFLSFEALWNPALVPPDILEEAWSEEEMERFADWVCRKQEWETVNPVSAQGFGESPRMMRLLEQKTRKKYQKLLIAACPEVSEEFLWRLTKSKDRDILFAAVFSPNSTKAIRAMAGAKLIPLKEYERSKNCIERIRLGRREPYKVPNSWDVNYVQHSIPPKFLLRRIKSRNAEVRARMARYPQLPLRFLETLAADNKPRVRAAVAVNSKCPESLLERFATDKHLDVQCAALGNPRIPVHCLKDRVTDDRSLIRQAIAANPACDDNILKKLASDVKVDVRIAVAGNDNATEEMLLKLSSDDELAVRGAVAYHPKTPTNIKKALRSGVPWYAYPQRRKHADLGMVETKRKVTATVKRRPALLAGAMNELPQVSEALTEKEIWEAVSRSTFRSGKVAVLKVALDASSTDTELRNLLDDPEKVIQQIALAQLGTRHKARREEAG